MIDSSWELLFGSSFSPPHIGHVAIAHLLHHFFPSTNILLSVSPDRIDKVPYFDGVLRWHWAKSFSNLLNSQGIHANLLDMSVMEHEKAGTYYLVERLLYLHPEKKIALVLGVDSYLTLPSWQGFFLKKRDSEKTFNLGLNETPILVVPRGDDLKIKLFDTHHILLPSFGDISEVLRKQGIDLNNARSASSSKVRIAMEQADFSILKKFLMDDIFRSLGDLFLN